MSRARLDIEVWLRRARLKMEDVKSGSRFHVPLLCYDLLPLPPSEHLG